MLYETYILYKISYLSFKLVSYQKQKINKKKIDNPRWRRLFCVANYFAKRIVPGEVLIVCANKMFRRPLCWYCRYKVVNSESALSARQI